jgi:hypothetical protein
MEYSIKVSNRINLPEQGIGRVVLTQKCLYFMEQGTLRRKILTELKNITELEKIQYYRVLNAARAAIKITTNENKVINLCLDNERDIWYLLLNELCSAIYLAEEYRDPTIVQYAAKNSLLLSVVAISGQDVRTTHSQDVEQSTGYLTYYTMLRNDESSRQSTCIKQNLTLRINPSSREFEKQSIESMIYIEIDEYPTVWCALGNRIKIYEAITWTDETADIKLTAKIVR